MKNSLVKTYNLFAWNHFKFWHLLIWPVETLARETPGLMKHQPRKLVPHPFSPFTSGCLIKILLVFMRRRAATAQVNHAGH
jgi:hypothetical protein